MLRLLKLFGVSHLFQDPALGRRKGECHFFFFFFLRKQHNTEQHWFCTAVCVLCLAFKTHNQRLLFHRACFCAHIDGLEMKDLKYKA